MEKRGLKRTLRQEKSDERDMEVDIKLQTIIQDISNENKNESSELPLNPYTKDASKRGKISKLQTTDSLENVISQKKIIAFKVKEDEKKENGDNKVTTRSKKTHKQMKITDTLKPTAKGATISNKQLLIKQDKKSDLIITLRLEGDSITNCAPAI